MRPTAAPAIHDGTDLADETLRGLRLDGATLRDVHFADCRFERGTFVGTTFSHCSFTGCTFTNCDLSLVRLPNVRFMDVAFVDSKLVGVVWTTVELPARLALSVGFERCAVGQSIFAGLNLHGLRLVDSVARESDFAGADLTDAVCTGTDFASAEFDDTTLIGADFRGATSYQIDPVRNRVRRAKFALPDAIGLLTGLGIVVE